MEFDAYELQELQRLLLPEPQSVEALLEVVELVEVPFVVVDILEDIQEVGHSSSEQAVVEPVVDMLVVEEVAEEELPWEQQELLEPQEVVAA
jgi:hypothetical protein